MNRVCTVLRKIHIVRDALEYDSLELEDLTSAGEVNVGKAEKEKKEPLLVKKTWKQFYFYFYTRYLRVRNKTYFYTLV